MLCPRCKNEISEEMNFCPHCGMKIEKCPVCHQIIIPGAQYCSHCGANLNTQQSNQFEGYYQPLNDYDQPVQNKQETHFRDIHTNRQLNKKVIIISVVVLVLVTAVSYAYIYYGPSISNLIKGNTSQQLLTIEPISIDGDNTYSTYISNINQNGEVFQDGDKIYMCNDQGYLVCMDRDLDNQEVIIDEVCQYVTVVDDMIYYVNEDMQICSSSLDGQTRTVLLDVAAYYVVVKDGKIYYQSDGDSETIHVYDLATNEDQKLNDRRSYNLNVMDDVIYYSGTDGIYKIGIDGQGDEKIISDTGVGLVYQDDILYSMSNDGVLSSYDIQTGQTKQIVEDCYMLIGITNQYLFYYDQSYSLVRYDLTSQEFDSIYSGYITTGYVVGDKLVLSTFGQYQSSEYKIIMDFDGSNQQRIFVENDSNFV